MLAVIRLVVTFAGASTPYVSCVIFPIAPTGVVSVSPVARHATIASTNESNTAMTESHGAMPKPSQPTITSPIVAKIIPAANQRLGTSIAAI